MPAFKALRSRVNKRESLRFEKAFPVVMRSEIFGECVVVARNISTGGILLEVQEPLPMGTEVKIVFSMPESQAVIVARGEVKNHYFLNFSDEKGPRSLTGMAVRFIEFEEESRDALDAGLNRMRILH